MAKSQKKTTKISSKNQFHEQEKKQNKKDLKYFKRSVIKLGSSYAVTFPKSFLEPWIEDLNNIKSSNVHCYVINENSVLIRKSSPDSEKQVLEVKLKSIPTKLLPKLINSAHKLNIHEVILDTEDDEDLYDYVTELINYERLSDISEDERYIKLDLSFSPGINFPNLVKVMVKKYEKIVKLTIEHFGKPMSPEKINRTDKYLSGLNISYNKALSSLINLLNHYYTQTEKGTSNIINVLGNRVLISEIRKIAESAQNLFFYKDSEEIGNYIDIIKVLPDILNKEVDLLFKSANIQEIEMLNTELTKCEIDLPSIYKKTSADEINIRAIIRNTLNTLGDILELILTRWIEQKIKYK